MTTLSDIAKIDRTHIVYIETSPEEIQKRWVNEKCKDWPELVASITAMAIRVFPDHDEVWLTFDEDWLGDESSYFEIGPYRMEGTVPDAQIPMFGPMTVGQMMSALQTLLDRGTVKLDTEIVGLGPVVGCVWTIDRMIKYNKKHKVVEVQIEM